MQAPSAQRCFTDAFEIGPNSMQQDDKLTAFVCTQALDRDF